MWVMGRYLVRSSIICMYYYYYYLGTTQKDEPIS